MAVFRFQRPPLFPEIKKAGIESLPDDFSSRIRDSYSYDLSLPRLIDQSQPYRLGSQAATTARDSEADTPGGSYPPNLPATPTPTQPSPEVYQPRSDTHRCGPTHLSGASRTHIARLPLLWP